ncbi:MAG TPA: Rrf2 family transcriptional regulator [Ktedonobacterales bacterium]|jgi:Rrf2 family protein|nr:Rrf2 family transcriptional regulator [Ktedonobacterales bacterium]
MRLTMKGDYGLRAMIDMAGRYGQGPTPSAEIARRQAIPEHFLDQVLITLRRAGLVKSQRGPQGGHMLAKAPAQISMYDVLVALEGAPTSLDCVPQPGSCQLSPGCGMRDIWAQIDTFAHDLLSATTLDKLAARHHALGQEAAAMYYI